MSVKMPKVHTLSALHVKSTDFEVSWAQGGEAALPGNRYSHTQEFRSNWSADKLSNAPHRLTLN